MDRVHSGLIERLEAAEVGSRELDAEIWFALFEPDIDRVAIETIIYQGEPREVVHCELGSRWADERQPPIGGFTTSLDAALALAERVLPDAEWMVLFNPRHGETGSTYIGLDGGEFKINTVKRGKAPALALCIAILKAKTAGYEPQANEPNQSQHKGEGE